MEKKYIKNINLELFNQAKSLFITSHIKAKIRDNDVIDEALKEYIKQETLKNMYIP